jgi:hypothetical protein
MRKNIINLRILFFILLSIVMIKTNAQTGLNFQGVARTSNNVILASQAITIKLSILQGSVTGTAEYTETRKVTTNAQGLFTAVIGDTGAISTLGNFTTINWKLTPKFLKIEMDPAAGTNFITMGTTQFQYVAYAQFAKSVDAENIVGIVPVTSGGTGVNSLTGLKTALTLNNVNNTTDLAKPISTLTQTALDLKLNTADTSKYTKQTYTDSALLTKLKISDTAAMLSSRIARDTLSLSNRINLKANTLDVSSGLDLKLNKADTIKFTKQTYTDSALLTKLKISDTAAMLSSRIARDTLSLSNRINLKANTLDVSSGLDLKLNTADTSKYTKQTYTDSALLTKLKISDTATMLSSRIARDTLSLSNRLNLKANTIDVTTSLSLKETISNKSTAVDLGAGATSDILFPTQKAVKTYVDNQINSGGITDGGILTRHLADAAVTGEKISNSIIGYKKFFDGAGNVTISSSVVIDVLIPTGAVATGGISNWQSFTAGMSGKLSLVEFETSNPNSTGPAATVYVEVYSGQGLSGTLLGTSASQTIAGFGSSWKTFDFGLSNIEVLSGNVYTARIVTNSSDQNWLYGGNATYTSGISNVSSTWDHNIKTSVRQYNDDPYLTIGLASNLYGGLVSNATHTGDVSGSTILSITASSNSTITSLPNLATVGTITSGIWSGTAVAVARGGTGVSSLSDLKSSMQLNNVNNTSDLSKPISTATQAALSNKLDITGNAATATSAITAGTASSATKLTTARNINGVAFDGSGDITVTADAGTLTGTSIKSTVTGSSLTSVGTLTNATVNGKVIVGSSTSASTSALLEVNSTTQGFLPPRMTRSQRDNINTPVSGLIVWCINCGPVGELQVYSENASWTNLAGTPAAGLYTPNIGETYQGGKVAYVLQSGDPGYDATTPHGLIAANSDLSTRPRWYNGTYTTTGATGTAIGTGLSNTNTIIASQGATATSYAAGLARAYTGGGYTDWYLPSKDELNILYINKVAIGGFSEYVYYWSSTEYDNYNVWAHYFGIGMLVDRGKSNTYTVRAIRSF